MPPPVAPTTSPKLPSPPPPLPQSPLLQVTPVTLLINYKRQWCSSFGILEDKLHRQKKKEKPKLKHKQMEYIKVKQIQTS